MERFGVTSRKTGETDVETSILIDGEGLASLSTGIGFFDHMLNLCLLYTSDAADE